MNFIPVCVDIVYYNKFRPNLFWSKIINLETSLDGPKDRRDLKSLQSVSKDL